MLIRAEVLDGIRRGTVRLAFRRWRRATVRPGGTLLTGAGQLEIKAVSVVPIGRISSADARRAGYESRAALLADLNRRTEGNIYRIEFGALRPDPRTALRASPAAGDAGQRELRTRLDRLDARGPNGPWTREVLRLLRDHPGVAARDLCVAAGQPKDQFKQNVRKLKALGLTESLEVGYRLSPRGLAVLAGD